jgi:hypothetical protein
MPAHDVQGLVLSAGPRENSRPRRLDLALWDITGKALRAPAPGNRGRYLTAISCGDGIRSFLGASAAVGLRHRLRACHWPGSPGQLGCLGAPAVGWSGQTRHSHGTVRGGRTRERPDQRVVWAVRCVAKGCVRGERRTGPVRRFQFAAAGRLNAGRRSGPQNGNVPSVAPQSAGTG